MSAEPSSKTSTIFSWWKVPFNLLNNFGNLVFQNNVENNRTFPCSVAWISPDLPSSSDSSTRIENASILPLLFSLRISQRLPALGFSNLNLSIIHLPHNWFWSLFQPHSFRQRWCHCPCVCYCYWLCYWVAPLWLSTSATLPLISMRKFKYVLGCWISLKDS